MADMNDSDKLDDRYSQLDPTGEVYFDDPVAVESAIRSILDSLYGGNYHVALLADAIRDVVSAYRGNYPGLLAAIRFTMICAMPLRPV